MDGSSQIAWSSWKGLLVAIESVLFARVTQACIHMTGQEVEMSTVEISKEEQHGCGKIAQCPK